MTTDKIPPSDQIDSEVFEGSASDEYLIKFEQNRVNIVGTATISIKSILSLNQGCIQGFKRTVRLVGNTGRYAPDTLTVLIRALERGVKRTNCKELNLDSYYQIVAALGTADKGRILSFLKTWRSASFPGLSDDLNNELPFLNGTAQPRSNRRHSVTDGPYSDQEYDDLISTFWHDYDTDRSTLMNTTLNLLNAQFSRRPKQYAQLKILDFEILGSTNSVSGPRVSFPGVKDRNTSAFRTSKFETHPLSEDLWKLCKIQIADAILTFEAFTGKKVSIEDQKNLPFFITPYKKHFLVKLRAVEQYAPADEYFSSALWHLSSTAITQRLADRAGSPVHSFRTGETLNEFAYRMRYTRAKQLAKMGVSKAVLGYWLGHTGDASVDSYYDDPAERAKEIQESMGHIFAPIAQAFSGCIVDQEKDAIRGSDPTSRIELDGKKSVGSCGHEGFCSASVPIPCYRCNKFQPWVDGPHEEVLIRLRQRQEEENNIFIPSKARRILAPLQLDKDIRAVETVIALCRKRKQEK